LTTPEAYAFSSETAASIAHLVLHGDAEPGFHTPARVYGADFVLRFAGVSREDLV
jgi:saccharopine dehydrogenase (NAD+, L-lysine-forming)